MGIRRYKMSGDNFHNDVRELSRSHLRVSLHIHLRSAAPPLRRRRIDYSCNLYSHYTISFASFAQK
jgi:hypothetical protein